MATSIDYCELCFHCPPCVGGYEKTCNGEVIRYPFLFQNGLAKQAIEGYEQVFRFRLVAGE